MKFRKLFSVIGLGLFAMATVGASAFALKNSEAKRADADADTWMIHFSLNSKEIAGYMDEGSMWLQTYTDGVGNDKWFQMYPISEGSQYFAVNATFPETYTYNRIQFKFTQGGTEKWGVPYNTSASKAEHSSIVYSTFSSWSGDQWSFSANSYHSISVSYGDVTTALVEDVANQRFIARDFVCDGSGNYTFYYRGSWAFAEDTLTTSAKENFSYLTTEWCTMKVGTYDIILKNNNSDGGIIDVKKHVNEYVGVYLVGIDEDVFVYTFGEGGIEDFGEFAGTRLGDIPNAHRILTDIKFQGNDWEIWYLPLDYGYPEADHIILSYKNDLGVVANQTANMLLSEGSAYWFSYDNDYHNDDAGLAIDFLCDAEEARKAATNESVCNVSKADATPIVNAYKGLSDTIKTTYINGTTVNTLKRDGSEGKEYVAYSLVMGEFARIANISLGGTNSIKAISVNTPTFIIVVAASAAFIVGLAIIFTAKKRQHN